MTITALVNTRNEAAHLADCLKSLAWADEVVVADMASTDDTCAIARTHGARVIEMPLAPVVEPVRNLAVSQCRSDWIVVVDADERISPRLAQRVRQLADTASESAFALPRRNYFLGTWLEHGFWPDYQIRFFRKGKVTWSETVHEHPRVDGPLAQLPPDPQCALEHPGFCNDLSRFVQKHCVYSRLLAEELDQTLRPPVWPYLLRRPAGEFYGRYFKEQAWRHGMHGLVWSLLMAVYQLLIGIHYWSLHQKPFTPPEAVRLRRSVRWELLRSGLKALLPWKPRRTS